ncbi:MAG: VCBS repeat-containing protein [Verrucomicrobiota bacterium]
MVATALLAGLLSSGWSQDLIQSKPLEPSVSGTSETLFQLLSPEESGVDLVIPIDADHKLSRAYHSSSACSAVAVGDLDLDGRPDIFAGNGPRQNGLFLQREKLKFEDVADAAGVAGNDDSWAVGTSLVDIDNDGDLDAYVCNYDYPNNLFINLTIDKGKRSDGPLRFEDRAAEYGLDLADGSVVSAFADYDRDGDLDLYILTHQVYREEGRSPEPINLVVIDDKLEVADEWLRWYRVDQSQRGKNGEILYTEAGRPDLLYRNDGNGKFTEVTAEAGIDTKPHWGNSATWWDYNYDGWPDLYIGNDFSSPDFLYRNNADGTFTEIAEETARVTTWFSMGAVQSDFNNDGYIDFLLADMLPKTHYMKKASMANMADRLDNIENAGGARQTMHNVLHINTGTDRFLEGAWMSGVAATEWTWAIRSADFDNDMRADIFFCNGVPRQFNHSDLPTLNHQLLVGRTQWEHYKDTPERREQNLAYRNVGDFQFEDVSKSWGLDHMSMSYGASLGDLDGDGRMDLLTSNLEDPLSVYWNRGTSGNRVLIDLRGTQSNRMGIGCLVTAETADGVQQSRQLFPYGGFLDADECVIHFGLGEHTELASLRVDWPSGQRQRFTKLAANRRYAITEPNEEAPQAPPVQSRKPDNPWFIESDAMSEMRHEERIFDDYQIQPLLPFKLSQLGPGQAWSDFDGDGDDDLFLAGAAGQPGRLFRNDTSASSLDIKLTPVPCEALEEDAEHEDMGALFFDADSDGNLDLYVASGSVESKPGAEMLRDRLYMNYGDGNFQRAPQGTLPDLRWSGSVVAPADFDRDGDLDLFVGSRSVPGFYPLSPNSHLLLNEGGRFSRAKIPLLTQAGLVTSAIWSDANGDSWPDLLITTEWGPIRLLINNKGKLEEATEAAKLDGPGLAMRGWWNGITGGDIDADGDIDYVVTNMGRNTQYQASLDSPELIFFGDFDNTGKSHIVEAQFLVEGGKKFCFPRRGFMAATDAMPSIADKMQTYHNYASVPITGIYEIEKLEKAEQFRANQMDHVVLINNGQAEFEVKPLPHISQVAPGFGVTLADVDLDGRLDAYLVQNHFEPPEEIGPLASGLSFLLRGTGDAAEPFEPIWSLESGLEVPGDAKSLAAVDVNQDGRIDFCAGVNDEAPKLFLNQTTGLRDTRPLRVRLAGKPGNLLGVGSQVRVEVAGLPAQLREVSGGGSYLAQSTSEVIFAIPNTAKGNVSISVRRPNGSKKTVRAKADQESINIQL